MTPRDHLIRIGRLTVAFQRMTGSKDQPYPNSEAARTFRLELEKYEQELRTEERRNRQVAQMEKNRADWFELGGDIGQFASDMVFHSDRLWQTVRGTFNGIILSASPGEDAQSVLRKYDEARFGKQP